MSKNMGISTKSIAVVTVFILIFGGGFLALLLNIDEEEDSMSDVSLSAEQFSDLPVVRASVGEHLNDVQAASSYTFEFSGRRDESDFIIEEPVVFEYESDSADDTLHFRLPPARFLRLSQEAGEVHAVTATPLLELADLESAFGLVQEISGRIRETAWDSVEAESVTLAELKQFFGKPSTKETARRTLRQWKTENTNMYLTLKRVFKAGSNRARAANIDEDGYLAELYVTNSDLGVRLTEKVYDRRRAAGDEFEALPLEVWLSDSTQQQ